MMRSPCARSFGVSAVCAALLTSPRGAAAADDPVALVEAPVVRGSDGPLDAFSLPRTYAQADGPGQRGADAHLDAKFRALIEKDVTALGGELEESDGARLRVIGPAAAADLVRRRSAELQAALDGAVVLDVTVARLPAGADPEPTRDSLATLVRSGGAEIVFGERIAARRGETVRRDAVDSRTFVAGYEAEVAQYASSLTPRTRRLQSGRRLAAQARTLPSGRAAVTLALHVVTPAEPMRHVTATAGTIDLPEATFTALSAPFVLAKGESGTAVVPDAAGSGTLFVRVTLVEAAAPQAGTQRLFDVRAVSGERVAWNRAALPGPLGEPGEEPAGDDGREARMQAALERLRATPIAHTELAEGLLLVDAAAAEAVEREFADALRTTRVARRTLRLPTAELTAAPWWDALAGRASAEPGAGVGRAGAPLRLPVRGDTPAVWMSGTWRRVVTGVTSEIAESAVAVIPVVTEHFAGETIVARAPTGAPVVAVDHATAALLDPAPLPGKARIDISATPRTDDVPLDGMTTAVSRSRFDTGRAPETTVRREGADSVISVWTAE